MNLIYAGFDKLDVAFQGALPEPSLDILRKAREEASKTQRDVLVSIGPEQIEMHVAEHGLKGGYAFLTDTGPTGEKWMIKDSGDAQQWNIAVSVHASSLASHSYHETRDRLWSTLEGMGARIIKESVRRVDYAMDFLAPDFELNLDRFVAHGHSKVQPHWGGNWKPAGVGEVSSVMRGRRLETVTVGKMPGRQVTIYDKRKASIEQRKFFWFKIWDVDQHDSSQKVWRVEVRAGKKELKDRWQIRTFEDVENSIGDVFREAVSHVRYLSQFQTDGNVSRQNLHPLWEAVIDHLENSLMEFRSGLLPGQLREIERQATIDNYFRLFRGNAAGLAVALGLTLDEIEDDLITTISNELQVMIDTPDGPFWESYKRAQEKFRFLA